MQVSQEVLPGATLIRLHRHQDDRGLFVKTFSRSWFAQQGLQVELQEEFYSTSHRDVIRGMHFQLPPHDHAKVVSCLVGAVDDVLLDLRTGSGYGRAVRVRLSADEPAVLLIPKGIAHGFRSLTDNSLMLYKTSTEHAPSADAGIRWDSFGMDWGCDQPVMSARDRQHPALADFSSPF
jgi:dTDP-4-dehydrorhamnose 3,5-epimerase